MASYTLRISIGAALVLATTACTKKEESAQVVVRLPSTGSAAATSSSKSTRKVDAMAVTSAMGWGLDRPLDLSQAKCFAVVVELPDDSSASTADRSKKCTAVEPAHDIKASYFAGLAKGGSTLELTVPAGAKRKFHVFAFAAESEGDCVTLTMGSTMKTSRLSAPLRIGLKEADIVSGNNEVEIQASFNDTVAFDNCEWKLPANLAGGSLTINGGSFATNNPVLNVVPFVPFTATEAYYTFGASCGVGGAWQPYVTAQATTAPAGDGLKTIRALFRDSQGAVSGCLSASITLDQTSPTVSLDPPTNANIATSTAYSLSGTCSENGRSVEWNLNAGALTGSATCTAGYWSASALSLLTLSDGIISVAISQSDAATNVGLASGNFIKDSVMPTLAITSPAPGSFVNAANAVAFIVTGSCSESGRQVALSAGVASTSTLCNAGTFSGPIDVTSLPDGALTIDAAITDVAGNAFNTNRNFNKDTVAPTAIVSGIPGGISLETTRSLTVSGSDVVNYRWLTTTSLAACSVLSNYTAPVAVATPLVAVSAAPGGYYVCVLGVDLAGNTQSEAVATIGSFMKGPVTISFAAAVSVESEAMTMRNIPISVSPVSTVPISIDIQTQGTAVAGTHYTSPFSSDLATVVIPANTASYNFAINVTGTTITQTEAVMSLSIRGSSTLEGIVLGVSDHQAWIEDSGAGPNAVTKLAVGASHACSINAAGKLFCWGSNGLGQLGNGTTVDSPTPVAVVDGGTLYAQVAIGTQSTCAITNTGVLKCWGANGFGQLGIGNTTTKLSPQTVGSNMISVAVGNGFACAANTSYAVLCWGDQTNGRVGNGFASSYTSVPVSVGGLPLIQKVTAGWDHACAKSTTGGLFCWGGNATGQLGIGNTNDQSTAVPVTGAGVVIDVSAGLFYTCAVRTDNTAICWGAGNSGKLGNSMTSQQNSPVLAQSGLYFDSIQVGSDTTCAVETGTLTLKCWGYAYYGILGDGAVRSYSYAAIEPKLPGPVGVVAMGVNGQSICASSGGRAYCWGSARSGVLGNGMRAEQPGANISPNPNFTKVSLGRGGCGITPGGKLMCWGPNDLNSTNPIAAVGDGSTIARFGPVYVDLLTNYADVAVGVTHSCAVTTANVLKCWGMNSDGQLGDGTYASASRPVAIGPGYTKVAVGSNSSCAIKTDGSLWCWGGNAFGQIGDGTNSISNLPIQIMSGTMFTTIDIGTGTTCAITTANSLYCWGKNVNGQIGDGSVTNSNSPVLRSGSWTTVSVGAEVVCAIDTITTLYCSGRNQSFEIGTGSNTPSYLSSPVAKGTGFNAVDVGMNQRTNAPGAHTCAVWGTTLKCWGAGAIGQHAPWGTLSSPINYDGGSYSSVVAGEAQTCARTTGGTYQCHGLREEAMLPMGVSNTLPNLVPRVRF